MPVIITLLALAVAGLLGHMAAAGAQPLVLVAMLALVVSLFAFFSPKASLVLLVISMLLSPKLGLGAASESRSIVVRYDDILLFVIFFGWFARNAVFKERPFITSTPVQAPILIYTALYVLSSALGVIRGDIDIKAAVFYLLKYTEYFLLFFMTVNIVETQEDIKRYLRYGAWVAVAVTIYAVYYYYASGPDARATAPFEAPIGSSLQTSEPASLGGYYLVVFGFLLGLLTECSGRVFLAAAALLTFMFPAFLLTFSRASYLGLAMLIVFLLFFTGKRKIFLFIFFAMTLAGVAMIPGIAKKVSDRVTMTYSGQYATQTFDAGSAGSIRLEDSAAGRVYAMRSVLLDRLPKHPLLGWGVTGVGLVDTQYGLLLGEVGIIGLLAFAWMMSRLFSLGRAVYSGYSEPWIRALALGFVSSLAGLLFQAVGVNTFIIVRIMEPFWFLAAVLSVLYREAQSRGTEKGQA